MTAGADALGLPCREPGVPGPGSAAATGLTGLTSVQVADRIAAGQTNATGLATSRTAASIVRANVFTVFNGLLVSLFVVIMTTGQWQNGLFGLVVVANAAIGIVQELRAKRTLDRLCLLNTPRARAVRDGVETEIAVAAVVLDDLLVLTAGDQVPADGVLITSDGLEVDESLLTGESLAVGKAPGDEVRSASIVVAGRGHARMTDVGPDAYAARLAAEARRFTLTRSELVLGTNRLLRWISVMLVVVGPVLLWTQFRSPDNPGWRDAVTGTVAALVGMVPEGLVLLTSLAFMIATVSLARRNTLVQELPAVEGLARVDVVCFDKTGTLTYGDMRLHDVELLREPADLELARQALGSICAAGDDSATTTALRSAFPDTTWQPLGRVPFSSARKWTAVTVHDHGTWVFGAPELVLPRPTAAGQARAVARADTLAAEGRRVLLLAHDATDEPVTADLPLPPGLVPVALVVLAERIREDVADTLRYFTAQGVAVKVISGDSPRTVGAVAAAVGMPGVADASDAIDARTLPDDPDALADQVARHSAFGRVTPHQKRAMVAALQSRGHVVAMTGDGVNDALALKEADIGVAMGNGSAATRAVAQLVLLDGRFSHLPEVVAEGRRVVANIERAANLFLVKNIYALVLALIVAVSGVAYPLAPIQLSLISAVTIGIPGLLLALGPNRRRYIPGFLRRVLRFAVPTGVITGISAYIGFQATRILGGGTDVAAERTTATLIVLIVSLWTVLVLARPLNRWKLVLVLTMAASVSAVAAIPPIARGIFLLELTPLRVAIAVTIGAVGAALVEISHRTVALALRLAEPRPDADASLAPGSATTAVDTPAAPQASDPIPTSSDR